MRLGQINVMLGGCVWFRFEVMLLDASGLGWWSCLVVASGSDSMSCLVDASGSGFVVMLGRCVWVKFEVMLGGCVWVRFEVMLSVCVSFRFQGHARWECLGHIGGHVRRYPAACGVATARCIGPIDSKHYACYPQDRHIDPIARHQ